MYMRVCTDCIVTIISNRTQLTDTLRVYSCKNIDLNLGKNNPL